MINYNTYEGACLALWALKLNTETHTTKTYLRTPPLDTIGRVPDKNWKTFSSNFPSIAYWKKVDSKFMSVLYLHDVFDSWRISR